MNDLKWNDAAGGCVFVPRVKLRDNWNWCTGTPAGGGSPQGPEVCDDPEETFIPFAGQIIVGG